MGEIPFRVFIESFIPPAVFNGAYVTLTILGAWLLADFLSGLVHWAQDKFLDVETAFNFTNDLKRDNDLHHVNPTAMLKLSFWDNIKISANVAWPFSAVLFVAGAPTVLWLGVFFSAFGNGVHRFAHVHPMILPLPIRALQCVGLFCSFEEHSKHHYDAGRVILKQDATCRYCVMTSWLNPILDGLRFWKALEHLIRRKP